MSAPLRGAVGPSAGDGGSAAVAKLARELRNLGAANRRALRRRFQAVSQPLLDDARARASWSTRIPDAMSVRAIVDQTTGRYGVQLRVNATAAPHARPYEGLSQQGNEGYFRHPVFGDLDTWVSQRTRPYAWPAVQAKAPAVRKLLAEAFEDAAREAGFR